MTWDVFISHAFEDKEDFVRPLAVALQSLGLEVWYDEFSLRLGDSLRESIEAGLSQSRFGVVVLSPAFFQKKWSQLELSALLAKELRHEKILLPIWHQVTIEDIRSNSLLLADRLAVSSSEGVESVAGKIVEAVKLGTSSTPSAEAQPQVDSGSVCITIQRERRLSGSKFAFDVYLDGDIVESISRGQSISINTHTGVHELKLAYEEYDIDYSGPMGPTRGWSKGWSPVYRGDFRQGEWSFECGFAPANLVENLKSLLWLSRSDTPNLFLSFKQFSPTSLQSRIEVPEWEH